MTDKYLIKNLDGINTKLGSLRHDEIIRFILYDLMPANFEDGFSSIMTTSGGKKSALLPYHVRSSVPGQEIPIFFVDHYYHTDETYLQIEKMENIFGQIKRYFPLLSKEEMTGMGFPPQPVSQEDFMSDDTETIDKVTRFLEFQYYAKGEPAKRMLQESRVPGSVLLVFNGRTMYQRENGRDKLRWLEYSGNGVYRVHPLLKHSESQILGELKLYSLPRNDYHIDPAKGITLECSVNTVSL